jgi:hypothetical protein
LVLLWPLEVLEPMEALEPMEPMQADGTAAWTCWSQ